jgi:hypothetical protein
MEVVMLLSVLAWLFGMESKTETLRALANFRHLKKENLIVLKNEHKTSTLTRLRIEKKVVFLKPEYEIHSVSSKIPRELRFRTHAKLKWLD